jgi:hypothetical protein
VSRRGRRSVPDRRTWVRLDNASNIFLAARTESDPKVFRLGGTVDAPVDPELLQRALDETFDRYRLYHAVLRGGVFWYYLQDSDLRPRVEQEDLPTCAALYHPERHNLLFRVVYHEDRISVEVFHALSDGTGALWFLSDLLEAYSRLRYPQEFPAAPAGGMNGADDATVGTADTGIAAPAEAAGSAGPHPGSARVESELDLAVDSFAQHFRRNSWRTPGPDTSDPGSSEPDASDPRSSRPGPETSTASATANTKRSRPGRAYRVRGTRNPDNRTRAVELTMPARAALNLAKAEAVSPTIYFTAMFFQALRAADPQAFKRPQTLAASVPVNLRQFFPSTSPRNFFATVRIAHAYGPLRAGDPTRPNDDAAARRTDPDSLSAVCRDLQSQFVPLIEPAELERGLRRLIAFERNPLLRAVPRLLKDPILRLLNWLNNHSLSIAVSNLGRVELPPAAARHVGPLQFQVSAARPQFCVASHAGTFTLTFTSPFSQTGHIAEFVRLLTERGVSVTVAAARVTEAELERAAS